jgi:hypothetical protein
VSAPERFARRGDAYAFAAELIAGWAVIAALTAAFLTWSAR